MSKELKKIEKIVDIETDHKGVLLEHIEKTEDSLDEINKSNEELKNKLDILDERLDEESKKDLVVNLEFAQDQLEKLTNLISGYLEKQNENNDNDEDKKKYKKYNEILFYLETIKEVLVSQSNDELIKVIQGLDIKDKTDIKPILEGLERLDLSKYESFDKRIRVKWSKEQLDELIKAIRGISINVSGGGASTQLYDKRGVAIDSGNPLPVSVIGGSTGGADPVGLKDTGGTPINPAKEDGNLADIKTSVQLIDDAIYAEGTTGQTTIKGIALVAENAQTADRLDVLKVDSGYLRTGLRAGSKTFADGQANAKSAFQASDGTETVMEVRPTMHNGTTHDLVKGDATNGLLVNLGANNDVSVTSQPARAAITDTITAKLATDAIQNGTTALTPKFAIIDATSSGDNTIVAAVSSKKIRVLSLVLVSAGTTTVRFESGASGTALTGQMSLIANVGFTLPFNPVGWFETAATTLLNLELSAAVSVDGCLTYVEV